MVAGADTRTMIAAALPTRVPIPVLTRNLQQLPAMEQILMLNVSCLEFKRLPRERTDVNSSRRWLPELCCSLVSVIDVPAAAGGTRGLTGSRGQVRWCSGVDPNKRTPMP